ncbi:MAG: RNA polymerase factor sigma-54 [Mariprofundaceae bacterium]
MQTKLSQKIGQRLALTPQLTQSLKVLAMNAMDLDAYIEECLESNPILEAAEQQVDERRTEQEKTKQEAEQQADWRESGDNRWESMYNNQSADAEGPDMRDQQWRAEQTVAQSLHEQVGRQPMSDATRAMANALIDMLDDDGYLRTDLGEAAADLDCDSEALEKTLYEVIQQLDPPGIGARNVSECLLLQLDGSSRCDALARQMLLHFSDALFEDDATLAEKMQCSIDELLDTRTRLRRLDPFPGHGMHGQENLYIRPEIIFRRSPQGAIHIEVPGYGWRGLRMSEQWHGRSWQGAEREFMDNATREAKWLLHALDQRCDTLFKVANCLAERQREFLEYGPLGLKPLTLQDVAEEVSLHESTISRVTNGKYAETPLGLIEMRRFFSAGLPTRGGGRISVYRVQMRVKALIQSEPASRPVSDQAIADRLCAEGIEIARRTVAKYRESMGIPPTSRRRKPAKKQHSRRQ